MSLSLLSRLSLSLASSVFQSSPRLRQALSVSLLSFSLVLSSSRRPLSSAVSELTVWLWLSCCCCGHRPQRRGTFARSGGLGNSDFLHLQSSDLHHQLVLLQGSGEFGDLVAQAAATFLPQLE